MVRRNLRVRTARLYATLVTLIGLGAGTYALALAQPGVPIHLPRAMRFTTACVSPATAVMQSFLVQADAIDAVTVYPVLKAGSSAAGSIAFELLDGAAPAGDGSTVLHHVRIDAASLAQHADGRGFRFALPRPVPANGRTLTLRIEARPEAGEVAREMGGRGETGTGRCLALEASGIHLPNGELFVGGRPQWGDLLLSVHASRGTRLHALQTAIGRRLGITPPLVVLGAVAIGYALALGWLCYALITPTAR